MRMSFVVCIAFVLPVSDAAGQQLPLPPAAPSATVLAAPALAAHELSHGARHYAAPFSIDVARATPGGGWSLAEQESGRRLSVAGAVGGFVVGAALGTLVACHYNRDSYGVFCLGQSDTKLAIGAAVGGAAGAVLGAHLFRRGRTGR
jgi:hypothetical protein